MTIKVRTLPSRKKGRGGKFYFTIKTYTAPLLSSKRLNDKENFVCLVVELKRKFMMLFTNPKLSISLKEKNGIQFFHEKWSGFSKSANFREFLSKSIDIYKAHTAKIEKQDHKLLLLGDASQMDLIQNDDMEWLADNINPLYEACGFTHQAVIMPERFFAQQSVKNYEELSRSGKMLTNVFKTEEEALKWFLHDKKVLG